MDTARNFFILLECQTRAFIFADQCVDRNGVDLTKAPTGIKKSPPYAPSVASKSYKASILKVFGDRAKNWFQLREN